MLFGRTNLSRPMSVVCQYCFTTPGLGRLAWLKGLDSGNKFWNGLFLKFKKLKSSNEQTFYKVFTQINEKGSKRIVDQHILLYYIQYP
jgi:hypothetical protein